MTDVRVTLPDFSGPRGFPLVLAVVFAETGLLVGFLLPADSILLLIEASPAEPQEPPQMPVAA